MGVGPRLESWLIDHIVVDGGPSSPEAWAALTALLGTTTWSHAAGTEIGLSRLAIDTGYEAPAVYAWARRMGGAQLVAVKGVDGFSRPAPVIGPSYVDATEGGRKIRRGAKLWTIAVATFKTETYRFLRLHKVTDEDVKRGAAAPAGFIHLPRGVDAEWVKQLVAEQLVTVKTRRGFTRLEWQKLRERNEALDCRIYARAAAWIAGLDRWHERKWRDLEMQLGIETKSQPQPVPQQPTATDAHGRRPADTAQPRQAGVVRTRPSGWLGHRQRDWLRRQ